MANAILTVVMNGDEDSTDLGIPYDEYLKRPQEERRDLINEYLPDVVDIFVKEDSE